MPNLGLTLMRVHDIRFFNVTTLCGNGVLHDDKSIQKKFLKSFYYFKKKKLSFCARKFKVHFIFMLSKNLAVHFFNMKLYF